MANLFLTVVAVVGVLELACSAYYVGTNKVPARTPKSMMTNGVIMGFVGMVAFALLVTQ